jgi:hypothetical protein
MSLRELAKKSDSHQRNDPDRKSPGRAVFSRFSFMLELNDGDTLFFPYQSNNNQPYMLTSDPGACTPIFNAHKAGEHFQLLSQNYVPYPFGAKDGPLTYVNASDEANTNLSRPQREFLLWHN